MKIGSEHFRTIWRNQQGTVQIIDQTLLPHRFEIVSLNTVADASYAIAEMQVRGAPLIGATASYGIALAMQHDPSNDNLTQAAAQLLATRPTAINLRWAVQLAAEYLQGKPPEQRCDAAYEFAAELCDQDVECCSAIGEHGADMLADIATSRQGDEKTGLPVQVITHCNAGWLATVDWGTALAPVYKAVERGIDVHVWVSETRPRNQGMFLTAWELAAQGVPHTVIADNAAGHLLQQGLVDACIVGTDRTLLNGSVCNKIGTYLKALACKDNNIPFYVAAPSSSIEWNSQLQGADIPIEQRSAEEVSHMPGMGADGGQQAVQLYGEVGHSSAAPTQFRNDAFDVTPASMVTGLITERGVCAANPSELRALFPERIDEAS